MYKRGRSKDTGAPTSPPGAPCHPAIPSRKACPCSGVVAALNGGISAWEEAVGWGTPLSYHGHGRGGGTSPLPWGQTS